MIETGQLSLKLYLFFLVKVSESGLAKVLGVILSKKIIIFPVVFMYSSLPCEICRVHAVVEDVDSCDLTQYQVAKCHDEAIPEKRNKESKIQLLVCWEDEKCRNSEFRGHK